MINNTDRHLLTHCRHHNPHGVYGWHPIDGQSARVTTRQLGATRVEVLASNSNEAFPLENFGDDIFSAVLPLAEPQYQLRITWADEAQSVAEDPYRFMPSLGEFDLHLIREGRHERLWEALGARLTSLGGISGTAFSVWAPNAAGVAVVGDFCGWNPNQFPMRSLGETGVWELFLPGIGPGTVYKYAIHTHDGRRIDKADPMARRAELPPATGSVVDEGHYEWSDAAWLEARPTTQAIDRPMSVYEVHLGSWKQGLSYRELAEQLVPYVRDLGYTHVEFMPVAEHPFGGSWGYQVSGYYAPTSRWGSPDDLRFLIDAFHQAGIGVILDWVPAHFPKDDFSLGRFDGQPLYEHPDWRRGEQRDWGTYVFDFGRPEVRNFLVANALYWFEEFHVDGLRVDAVASMLYLDYSRDANEWLPNIHGGREHLEAVQFLQEMNATVHKTHPGVLTIAEESTSWPGVTSPTHDGGLGFNLKWNMGWMNDSLEYFSNDPIAREHHHHQITFSMVYAFTERFILPYSHDEVVHGKGTLWTRMPGDAWNKAAGLRSLFAFMYAHPGRKLLFQGQEFGQRQEWSEARSLDWNDLEGWESEYHAGIHETLRDLNRLYKELPALHQLDDVPEGFRWIKADDAAGNVLAFARFSANGEPLVAMCNFSGRPLPHYKIGVPQGGNWACVFNSDAGLYQGADNYLPSRVTAWDTPWDGFEHSLTLDLPAMSVQWYRPAS